MGLKAWKITSQAPSHCCIFALLLRSSYVALNLHAEWENTGKKLSQHGHVDVIQACYRHNACTVLFIKGYMFFPWFPSLCSALFHSRLVHYTFFIFPREIIQFSFLFKKKIERLACSQQTHNSLWNHKDLPFIENLCSQTAIVFILFCC